MKIINYLCMGLGVFLIIGGILSYPESLEGNSNITIAVGAFFSSLGFSAIIYREGLRENKNDMDKIFCEIESIKNLFIAYKQDDATKLSLFSKMDDATKLLLFSKMDDATKLSLFSKMDDATKLSLFSKMDDATKLALFSKLDEATN